MDSQRRGLRALDDGLRGIAPARDALGELHACFKDISIIIKEAECRSPEDRKLILCLIGDRAEDVDNMIKQHMVLKANEAVGFLAHYTRQNACEALDQVVALPTDQSEAVAEAVLTGENECEVLGQVMALTTDQSEVVAEAMLTGENVCVTLEQVHGLTSVLPGSVVGTVTGPS